MSTKSLELETLCDEDSVSETDRTLMLYVSHEDESKSGITRDGRTVTIKPGHGPTWARPRVMEPEGASILRSTYNNGGVWTVEVDVPPE